MGNCQAAEGATVVIQHPGGRVERLHWPTRVEEVMRSNPGHHVALVTLCIAQERPLDSESGGGGGHIRFTRVRILKPKDMLLIGQVYRLITSQEVSKALKARKLEKLKKAESELVKKQKQLIEKSRAEQSLEIRDGAEQVRMVEQADTRAKDRPKSSTSSSARPRHWRPSLQSISESVS